MSYNFLPSIPHTLCHSHSLSYPPSSPLSVRAMIWRTPWFWTRALTSVALQQRTWWLQRWWISPNTASQDSPSPTTLVRTPQWKILFPFCFPFKKQNWRSCESTQIALICLSSLFLYDFYLPCSLIHFLFCFVVIVIIILYMYVYFFFVLFSSIGKRRNDPKAANLDKDGLPYVGTKLKTGDSLYW